MKKFGFFVAVAVLLTSTPPLDAADVELIAGWEGSGGRGYAFISPILTVLDAPAYGWLVRASASHLYYVLPEAGGETDVTSPGASIGVAYRKKLARGSLTLGPGYEIRDTQRRGVAGSEKEIERGFTLQGDLFYQPRPLDTIFAIASYGQANQYTWSRAGYKRQITNRDFKGRRAISLGGEVTAQGNDDLRSFQAGGFIDVSFLRSSTSIQIRSGYSRTEYDSGERENSPYFGMGFYRRF